MCGARESFKHMHVGPLIRPRRIWISSTGETASTCSSKQAYVIRKLTLNRQGAGKSRQRLRMRSILSPRNNSQVEKHCKQSEYEVAREELPRAGTLPHSSRGGRVRRMTPTVGTEPYTPSAAAISSCSSCYPLSCYTEPSQASHGLLAHNHPRSPKPAPSASCSKPAVVTLSLVQR